MIESLTSDTIVQEAPVSWTEIFLQLDAWTKRYSHIYALWEGMRCAVLTQTRCQASLALPVWYAITFSCDCMLGIQMAGTTLIFFARMPRSLARLIYSDRVIVALGLPKNSLIQSIGSATNPTPANTMKSNHPASGCQDDVRPCSNKQHVVCYHDDLVLSDWLGNYDDWNWSVVIVGAMFYWVKLLPRLTCRAGKFSERPSIAGLNRKIFDCMKGQRGYDLQYGHGRVQEDSAISFLVDHIHKDSFVL